MVRFLDRASAREPAEFPTLRSGNAGRTGSAFRKPLATASLLHLVDDEVETPAHPASWLAFKRHRHPAWSDVRRRDDDDVIRDGEKLRDLLRNARARVDDDDVERFAERFQFAQSRSVARVSISAKRALPEAPQSTCISPGPGKGAPPRGLAIDEVHHRPRGEMPAKTWTLPDHVRSNRSVRKPWRAKAIARLMETVVFPTPPFPLVTASV